MLYIDHINGGSNKHRQEVSRGNGGHVFYVWLRQNNFLEGYRVLCFNCNQSASHNDGICEYQLSKTQLRVVV